jgi:hypothetical protein
MPRVLPHDALILGFCGAGVSPARIAFTAKRAAETAAPQRRFHIQDVRPGSGFAFWLRCDMAGRTAKMATIENEKIPGGEEPRRPEDQAF